MKKLLAMILCVAMVLSFSATAFAAEKVIGEESTIPSFNSNDAQGMGAAVLDKWTDSYVANKAVKSASEAIEAMVAGLAADNGVYGTVKAIDGVVVDLSKELFKGIEDNYTINGVTVTPKNMEDLTKAYLRSHIGGEITSYMHDHINNYAELKNIVMPDGSIKSYTVYDPVKYMNAFATAASKAMGSAKAAKNLQAIVYGVTMVKTQKDVLDGMKDLYDEWKEWDDGDDIFGAYGFNSVTNPKVTAWEPLALLDADNVTLNANVAAVMADWLDPTNGGGATASPTDGSITSYGTTPSVIGIWSK